MINKKGNAIVILCIIVIVILGLVFFIARPKKSENNAKKIVNNTTSESSKFGKYELIYSLTPEKMRNMSSEELVSFRKLKKEYENDVKEGKIKPIVPKYIEDTNAAYHKELEEYNEAHKEEIMEKEREMKLEDEKRKRRYKESREKIVKGIPAWCWKDFDWLEDYEEKTMEVLKKESLPDSSKYGKYELIYTLTPEKVRAMSKEEIEKLKELKADYDIDVESLEMKPIVSRYVEIQNELVEKAESIEGKKFLAKLISDLKEEIADEQEFLETITNEKEYNKRIKEYENNLRKHEKDEETIKQKIESLKETDKKLIKRSKIKLEEYEEKLKELSEAYNKTKDEE